MCLSVWNLTRMVMCEVGVVSAFDKTFATIHIRTTKAIERLGYIRKKKEYEKENKEIWK